MQDDKVVKRRLEELRAAFLTSDANDPMLEKVGWIRAHTLAQQEGSCLGSTQVPFRR